MSENTQVNEQAARLLAEAMFAAALFAPSTAVSLSRSLTDRAVWRDDEKAMSAMHAQAAVSRATTKDSFLAPLMRAVANSASAKINAGLGPRAEIASKQRQEVVSFFSSEETENRWMDYNTPAKDWPTLADGKTPKTPIQVALEPGDGNVLFFTPYQYQAAGVIEMVRAAGTIIGQCGSDNLATQFMKLILAFGGEPVAETVEGVEVLDRDRSLPAGGFTLMASNGFDEDSVSLTGPAQHKAITILAAWLRMSKLGVRLASLDRLESWSTWFDGVNYGTDPKHVGEAWKMNADEAAMAMNRIEIQGAWANPARNGQLPWLEKEGGSPNVFVGMSAELLTIAIHKSGIMRSVSDGYFYVAQEDEWHMQETTWDLPSPDAHRSLVNDKVAFQLNKLRSEITGTTQGSVKSIRLLRELKNPDLQ